MHAVPRKRIPLEDEEEDLPPGPPVIEQPALFSLRLRWAGLMLVSAVLWVLGYRFFKGWWQAEYAARWMILSGLGLGFFLWRMLRALPENHRAAGEALLPKLGLGLTMTFWRGVLGSALLGFLISPQPQGWQAWLPGVVFAVSALLKPVSEFLARREGLVTCLGKRLEALVDAASLLTATLLAVQYGQAPWWYLLVGLGHALYLVGLWLRQRQDKPVSPLTRSASHRALSILEYALLCVILIPLFAPPLTTIAASVLMLVLLFGLWKDWRLASCAG